jgi:hypothetical protein
MPTPDYFLRQADICLRLSVIASDDEVCGRLIAMAQEYKAKAAALRAEPHAPASGRRHPGAAAGHEAKRS